jgi:DNA-binding transcriptional MerR regulator
METIKGLNNNGLNKIAQTLFNKDSMDFLLNYKKKIILLKDTDISSRNFKYWKDESLLMSKEEKEGKRKWERLSFPDLIWLYCIDDLRKFNVSLDTIREIKKTLSERVAPELIQESLEDIKNDPKYKTQKNKINKIFTDLEDLDISEADKKEVKAFLADKNFVMKLQELYSFTLFELILLSSIINIQEVGFLWFSDRSCFPYISELHTFASYVSSKFYLSHIYISITNQYKRFLSSGNIKKYALEYKLLSRGELEVLSYLQDDEFYEIAINKERKFTLINAKTKILYDKVKYKSWERGLILKYPYCSVKNIVHDGKISAIELTVSKKIDK